MKSASSRSAAFSPAARGIWRGALPLQVAPESRSSRRDPRKIPPSAEQRRRSVEVIVSGWCVREDRRLLLKALRERFRDRVLDYILILRPEEFLQAGRIHHRVRQHIRQHIWRNRGNPHFPKKLQDQFKQLFRRDTEQFCFCD